MERELSPITPDGIGSESTPIRNRIDSTEYITARGGDDDDGGGGDVTTSSYNRLDDEETEKQELQTILDTHPDLNIAGKETHKLNPVNVAHVMFSPRRKNRQRELQSFEDQSPIKSRQLSSSLSSLSSLSSVSSSASPLHQQYAERNSGNSRRIFDPYTPYTLNLYLQLIINLILWSFIVYLIYVTITTINSDIQIKIEEFSIQILEEISACSREYLRNKCDSPDRPRVIDHECSLLDKCRNQDPMKFARSKISIELIAEIINAFFDKISYKSLIILVILLVITIVYTSITLKNYQVENKGTKNTGHEAGGDKEVTLSSREKLSKGDKEVTLSSREKLSKGDKEVTLSSRAR
ncbi:hypothetical protein KGF56_000981 [Candida oxycetoniae]|uniref:Brl1/Brr6 domain-containing protein n=1 Tax=Candida oxycetoniae TaxID=497107 RepID=A0AAI9T036_9ASCO|nr:uncharacterized protein KGF56_000981 [Candida oxycetoniae]KAI3406139.2 hypothetical protein KGF56_000981 [Candida oxycetoniae]